MITRPVSCELAVLGCLLLSNGDWRHSQARQVLAPDSAGGEANWMPGGAWDRCPGLGARWVDFTRVWRQFRQSG